MFGGEPEDSGYGGKVAARIWICTKAVTCNGHRNMERFRSQRTNSVIESGNWSCGRRSPKHEQVAEFPLIMHERGVMQELKLEIDVPCVLPRRLLWCSAPEGRTRKRCMKHCGNRRGPGIGVEDSDV